LTGEEDLTLESLPNGPLSIPFNVIYEGYDPPGRVKEGESSYETFFPADELVDA